MGKPMFKTKGFTLIELMLVMVIISIIIYSGIGYVQQRTAQIRITRTSEQMQQILNAALAYYVANGRWPGNLADLQNGTYLPTNAQVPLTNPWGQGYSATSYSSVAPGANAAPRSFYLWTPVRGAVVGGGSTATANARSIAGTLPFGYTSGSPGTPPTGPACGNSTTTCYVVTMINVPGQNLNNATAVTFAGLYKHGGCVPVPQCPVDATNTPLTPQIIVAPVSVSGFNDPGSTNVYPISSFTAYATGGTDKVPPVCKAGQLESNISTGSLNCETGGNVANYDASTKYWRVCLDITTEKGNLTSTNTATGTSMWGKDVTVMAITRCSITGESAGTNFNVFSN